MSIKDITDGSQGAAFEVVPDASDDTTTTAAEPEAISAETTAPEPARATASDDTPWGGWKWVSLVLAVLLALVLGGGGWQLGQTQELRGQLGSATASATMLETRVTNIHTRVVALQQELAGLQTVADEIAALGRSLDEESQKLAALSAPEGLPAVAAPPSEPGAVSRATDRAREVVAGIGTWVNETATSAADATRAFFSSKE